MSSSGGHESQCGTTPLSTWTEFWRLEACVLAFLAMVDEKSNTARQSDSEPSSAARAQATCAAGGVASTAGCVASTAGGGASTAALFLKEFVGETKWVHMDLAGPSFLDSPAEAHTPKGGTGYGVLTLLEYAKRKGEA